MINTTERILEYIKQITSDDFDHIEQNIKNIKEQIQSAINAIDRIWDGYIKKEIDIKTPDGQSYIRDEELFLDGDIQVDNDGKLIDEKTTAKKLLEEIKASFDVIKKENIIGKIDDYIKLLNCNYKLFQIQNINKGAIVVALGTYNINIMLISDTFVKIKEEICNINFNINRQRLIKTNLQTKELTTESKRIIEEKINNLTNKNKKRLANYLCYLAYKNSNNTEITFNLKDLRNICKWLASEKDEEMKLKLDDNFNATIKHKVDNALEIQQKNKNNERKQETNKTYVTIINQEYKIENLKKAEQTQMKTEPKKPPSKEKILKKIGENTKYSREILTDICTLKFKGTKIQIKGTKIQQCNRLNKIQDYLEYFIESKFKNITKDDITKVIEYYMYLNPFVNKTQLTGQKLKFENIKRINKIITQILNDIKNHENLLEQIKNRVKEIQKYSKDIRAYLNSRNENRNETKEPVKPGRISEIDCIELRF